MCDFQSHRYYVRRPIRKHCATQLFIYFAGRTLISISQQLEQCLISELVTEICRFNLIMALYAISVSAYVSTSLSKPTFPDFRRLFHRIPFRRIPFVSRSICIQCAVRFRPCIDIHKGKVKQIVGSTLSDLKEGGSSDLVTNFESDKSASEYARCYQKDGLTGGHVIMLGADPLSQAAAIEALHAYPGGLQVGGGINSDNALNYIKEGASHVIVTSYVFNNGKMDLDRLNVLIKVVGKKRLVLDLSCRKKDGKYVVVTDRWQKFSDLSVDEPTLEFLATYADEFLVHGVDVEGKKLGIDEELVSLLGKNSKIPVTYAGGVTVMEDLDRIKVAGKGRVDVTVGSALDIFGGNLPYTDVVAWHLKQRILTPNSSS